MDWATMRALVAERLGLNLSTDASDGQVDPDVVAQELHEVYRFTIPNRVHAACRRGFFDLAVSVAGGATYALDAAAGGALVRGLRGPVLYGTQSLDFSSDPERFFETYSLADTATGTPQAVLVEGRTVTVAPTPAATYAIRFRALFYRDEIPTAEAGGLEDDVEAKACVFGAAYSIAAQDGDDELAGRMGTLFEAQLEELRSKYGAHDTQAPGAVNGGF